VPVSSVQRYDPLTDRTMALLARRGADEKMSFFLSLLPGQSCFLTGSPVPARSVPVQAASGAKGVELTGEWQLEFVAGKPGLPPPARLPTLTSWTTLGDTAAYFSGTARYALTFDLPESSALERSHRLSLGDVREVAEVRLNGQDIGTAWCLPYDVEVPKGLLRKQGNTLDVKVSNLSFNYMRLHDRLQPGWKKFYDINIVNIRYQPFDASKEPPMPSGLLGPVRLEP
ncbi:MAG: glycoside hydrolase, partial [Cytophagaceae bacterium]|nr:glycoside hydrolase [Cytophagaceae bacterium]